MKTVKDIKQLIREFRVTTSAEMDREVCEDVLAVVRKTKQTQSAGGGPSIWRIIMKNRISKLAVAAVIIIGVLIGVNHFGGSIDGASVVWADVLKEVEQLKTAIFQVHTESEFIKDGDLLQVDKVEATVYFLLGTGYRQDQSLIRHDRKIEASTYFLENESTMIAIMFKDGKQTRCIKSKISNEQRLQMIQENHPKNKVEKIISLSMNRKELGRDVIDGVQVEGIEVEGYMLEMFANGSARLWVDIETNLPVRIETEGTIKATALSESSKQIQKIVYDKFQWNIPLESSIFEFAIAPDCTVEERDMLEMPEANEETLIEKLAEFAEFTEGKYPSKLRLSEVSFELNEVRKTKEKKTGIAGSSQEYLSKVSKMMAMCGFYAQLERDGKDVAYYGDRVTSEDVDAVLMRWRVSENEYRVLYGDLRMENVTAEQLADLEANQLE